MSESSKVSAIDPDSCHSGHATCRIGAVEALGTHGLARFVTPSAAQRTRGGLTLLGTSALVVLALGGLNWGLIGIAGVDAVAWLFGATSVFTRAIDVLFGISALYCLARLPHWSRAG